VTAVVGALAALLVLATVLRLVLRGRLRVRYAGLWLAVAMVVAVLALVPHLLTGTAGILGFRVPANFLFFAGLVLLVVVGIHLSVAVTTLEDRVQRLVEEFALAAERAGHDSRTPAAATSLAVSGSSVAPGSRAASDSADSPDSPDTAQEPSRLSR